MSTVLVTDAQMRSALAVIRSLGKKGITVVAGEESRFTTGFFSKYCSGRFVYPSPKKNKEAFAKALIKELKNKKYDALFPVADACLPAIVDNYDEISRYTKIALPPVEIFKKGYDKGITLKIAEGCHIPYPKTYLVKESDDISSFDFNLIYPAIIKPGISSGSRGLRICRSYDELVEGCSSLKPKFGDLLVQEYIPNGGEIGVYTLFNNDARPRALSVQRRIRSYPKSGGPSTFRETIKNDVTDRAVVMAFRLLKAMDWKGVAMVEFRIDGRDGEPKLMEVNPRFWGSLQLSILSGIDFPHLLYRFLMDGDVEPNFNYKTGVKCRWLLPGDILWYLSSPHKLSNLREFLRLDTPDDIISLEDPLPTLGFFAASARYALDRNMWNFMLKRE